MIGPVDSDARLRETADQLKQALAIRRHALAEVANEEQRSRRTEAIELLSQYAELLCTAPAAASASGSRSSRYWFKLELPDGRWNVAEKQLATAPQLGDIVLFDGGRWLIRSAQFVRPRPARKPQRQLFVCAPDLASSP